MKIRLLPASTRTRPKDLLVAFAFTGKTPDLGAAQGSFVRKAKATGDLSTKERAASLFHPGGAGPAKRVLFVGMGERSALTPDKLRRAAAVIQKRAAGLEVDSFRLRLAAGDHEGIDPDVAARALAEGFVLGAYRYDKPSKSKPRPRRAQNVEVHYLGGDSGLQSGSQSAFKSGLVLGEIGAHATVFARDIENMPGNVATPTFLAAQARKFKMPGLTVKVLGEAAMARLKMGALLGVSRGSKEPAKLIVLDYQPAGYTKTACVVGKGLTFDTGGISVKPAAKMDEMRYDMCGGGAVLGLFHAITNGGLKGLKGVKGVNGVKGGNGGTGKVRVVGVVPSAENMPDGDAQKPGDVVTACDGTTIEILNTDAEGRLILADALGYAKRMYQPDWMVDLATLTGAVVVALGHEMAGVMGTDDDLIDDLIEAGQACDEPLWQLPLWEVHREQLKSRFADVANLNSPAHGNGSTSGGAFLSYFTEDVKWAHIDIAGAAWGAKAKDYYTGGATGTAVRTLLHWVRSL